MGCGAYGNQVTVLLQAGETYYFQVGGISGIPGYLQLNVEEFIPPPPQVNFYTYPSDPSPYDNVSFCSNSYDPAGFGFQSFTWDFGDGGTSTANCASHQYAADGDYTVQHSATTVDGRTGSTSQVVQVRTHDVSIVRVSAPRSANAGQTRAITVSIRNTRYAETVRLDLYKSVAGGGFEFVGSSTQFVPVRSGNRTSDFVLNYTFTPADAQIGKVVFRVVVSILNARDAFSADNEGYSSPPTAVK
jgi:PKD repeat protein